MNHKKTPEFDAHAAIGIKCIVPGKTVASIDMEGSAGDLIRCISGLAVFVHKRIGGPVTEIMQRIQDDLDNCDIDQTVGAITYGNRPEVLQ